MNDTWVKLYRKINMNDIMRDPVALQLWIWIITNVNSDGEIPFSRYRVARELKVNPNTLYSALKRLMLTYKTINTSSTTKYSTIRVLNWDKYQPKKEANTEPSTTKHQPVNTYTRIKNKEKEYIINNEKNSDEFSELKDSLNIPDQPVKGISHEFQAEGIRIHKALGAPKERLSAYFKAVKEESRRNILTAFAFADDHPEPKARDKMFFWKLSDLKKGGHGSIQSSN